MRWDLVLGATNKVKEARDLSIKLDHIAEPKRILD